MKRPTILILGLALVVLSGCRATYGTEPYGAGFPRAGDLIRGASLDKALIVQSTLYPYHFVVDGAGLNELGERDLHVLAAHFRQSAGSLHVNRGGAGDALYDARVKAVLAALVEAGVDGGQMKLAEGLPGGDGMPSERIVEILSKPAPLGATTVGTGVAGTTSGSSF